MRKMAGELQISRESVCRVVERDLGLSSLKLRNVHSLTTALRQKRLERSRSLTRRFAAHGLDTVLYTLKKFSLLNNLLTIKMTEFLLVVYQR